MILRKLRPRTTMMIGMSTLVIASLGNWYLQRHRPWSTAWTDGVSGFLYGVAIATMLLAVRMYRRAGPEDR